MSGIRRLSDNALGGGMAGATGGQVPVYNSATGHAAPGAPKLDLRASLYNVNSSAFQKFRAAMGKALSGGSNAHIVCLGDSITAGTNTTAAANSYPEVLRALIDAKVGSTRGSGIVSAAAFSNAPPATGGVTDSRFVFDPSITWSNQATEGFGGGAAYENGNSGKTVTMTAVADLIDFYNFQITGGANPGWNVTLDAVAQTALSCNGGGVNTYQKVTYTPVSQASHTLQLTSAGTGYVGVLGVEFRQNGATGGVRVSRLAAGGMTSGQLATNTRADSALTMDSSLVAPDLTILLAETNDFNGQTSLASYQANMQALITAAKATGDVLLVSTMPPNGSGTITLPQYTQVLYTLCDLNNVGLLDLQLLYPTWALWNSLGLNGGNSYHPNDAGYRVIANAVYSALAYMGVGF